MRLLPLFAGMAVNMAFAAAGTAASLGAYAWKDRVIVVFADQASEALADQRRRLEAARPALEERDMAVLAVIGTDRVEHWIGPNRGGEAAALRQHFKVPAGQAFAIFLVGKDGGTKWSAQEPSDLEPVIGLVDGMPMRRREAAGG
ncbi:DUF4174 domain-containing protein [Roseomonas sp. ACRSG]|nr:DUF4174 domain-containing protein [Roseomonas sp. ACRSG]